MRQLARVATVTLVAALVIAGCNGSDKKAKPRGVGTTTTTSAPPATSRDLAITTETDATLPGFNIRRPADLDATGAPLPVVVWANGGCVRFDAPWLPILERWAKAGFFVISIDGGDVASLSTLEDQARAIDWVVKENERSASPYTGHLDVKRIVTAGNSCGGITALGVAASDPRVRAVFVLSGSAAPPGSSLDAIAEVMGKVEAPVGYVVGGPEDIAGAEAAKDYEALPEGVAAYIASRASGDHRKVSTDPDIQLDAANIAINWMDLVLYGNQVAKAQLLSTGCETCDAGPWTPKAKNLDSL